MTHEYVQPILDWIKLHPTWAGIAVFLISLSESLAIVGLVVPGVLMMTAIGIMMGGGTLPFVETLIWAILGAIAGDGISYWLGYHYHEHLRDFWPFKQFPTLLARGEAFFKDHGGKSIIFGRFVGPVRPMIPVIAGMLDMKPKRFLFFNIVSAIAWAPLYSLPGILIGLSLGTLSKEVASRIVLIILLALLVMWIIYAFLFNLGLQTSKLTRRSIDKVWTSWGVSNKMPWLHKKFKVAGSDEGQLGTVLLFLLAVICTYFIISNVEHSDGLSLWNEPIYQALRAFYLNSAVDWTAMFTGIGEPKVLLIVAAVIGVCFFWKKQYIAMFCWLGTVGLGSILGQILKHALAVARPEGALQYTQEYSFPSGHTITTTVVLGLAAGFIQQSLAPKQRWIPWAIVIPIILLMGFSRLYLGLHWFTDVAGGLTLGIACVCLGLIVFRHLSAKPPNPRLILIPGLIVLVLTMAFYLFHTYPVKRPLMERQWPKLELETRFWWEGKGDTADLYRTGAFKRIATYFDVQWLGKIDEIKSTLKQNHWHNVPRLDLHSSLIMLNADPTADTVPVLPKFHRGRLPVLTVAKPINNNQRLLLQLWQSDYVNEQGISLWVGTLRLEMAKQPLSLLTLYQETHSTQEELLEKFSKEMMQNHNIRAHIIPRANGDGQKILLLTSPSTSKQPLPPVKK